MFFFFKQKTAYEMRISDWSSDVCSSDLGMLTRSGLTTRCNAWAKSSPAPAVRHDPPALPLLRRHRLERRGDPRRRGRLPRRRVRVVRGHGRGDAQREHEHRSTRSEEHTSELQSLMRTSYAVFCLQKQN